jgi:hypothetical protein
MVVIVVVVVIAVVVVVGHNLFYPQSPHFFTLPFDVSSAEQMKNMEEWRLIVQEAKAHPEL